MIPINKINTIVVIMPSPGICDPFSIGKPASDSKPDTIGPKKLSMVLNANLKTSTVIISGRQTKRPVKKTLRIL